MLITAKASAITSGLKDLIDCGDKGTEEQNRVLQAISLGILKLPLSEYSELESINQDEFARKVIDTGIRRRYIQLAIMLELCRHPKSSLQNNKIDKAAKTLCIGGDVLLISRNMIDKSALEITTDFIRRYQKYFLSLQEYYGQDNFNHESHKSYDESFFQVIDSLASMEDKSLGNEFFQFYKRNGMHLPSRTSINPGYYVCHDMNHVLTGYEPTGIGEICLGAFKLGMNDSDANWMASMTNFLIHEAGVFKPGHSAQYEPYGADGDPFDGLDGKRGVMTLNGAPEMLADAYDRGSKCNQDFSIINHLEIASIPLSTLRKRFNIIPPLSGIADSSINWR